MYNIRWDILTSNERNLTQSGHGLHILKKKLYNNGKIRYYLMQGMPLGYCIQNGYSHTMSCPCLRFAYCPCLTDERFIKI